MRTHTHTHTHTSKDRDRVESATIFKDKEYLILLPDGSSIYSAVGSLA